MPIPRPLAAMAIALLAAAAAGGAFAESRSEVVEAPGPLAPLQGSLLGPIGPTAPVLLIFPGSGPTDRDGNGPHGLKASTYRLLAEGLAQKGIVTVRIDKLGMYGSARAVADPNAVTIEQYAADARSWVESLRRKTGAPCIWVAGHSEGGLVALAADRSESGICGLVLIATAGRPLGEVLREQLRANPANAPLLGQALPAIDALEAGNHVDATTLHPALQALFNAQVQDFLISTLAIDPVRLIAGYKKPVLILQGERDLQVSVDDAKRLQRAAPKAKLVFLSNVNHVLKEVATDDRAANLATYNNFSQPLGPGVVDAIATFIASYSTAR